MKRSFLVRAFVDELPLKLVSLFIAITLFVIVRSDKDAASGAFVRVVYTLPDDRVLVSEPVTEVRIGVRGSWTRLRHFDDRELPPVRIDLTHQTSSEVKLDATMIKLPTGLRVVSISPSEIRVRLEPRVQRRIAVTPTAEGEPADGFRLAHLTAKPDRALVDGAQSEVEALTRLSTQPLRITGARGPVRGDVGLEPLPCHVRALDGALVTVDARIEPAIEERVLTGLPVRVVGLRKLTALVEPATARLILRGPAGLVGELRPDEIVLTIDGQLIDKQPPGDFSRPVVPTGLPAGIAAEVQPDVVKVHTTKSR